MGAKLKVINVDDLYELAAQGLSQEMIAQQLFISADTLGRRLRDNALIADAYKRGKQSDVQQVVNKLKEIALNGNLGAICFYLKNKDPANWKEQHDVNHTGGLSINVAALKAPIEGQYKSTISNT